MEQQIFKNTSGFFVVGGGMVCLLTELFPRVGLNIKETSTIS